MGAKASTRPTEEDVRSHQKPRYAPKHGSPIAEILLRQVPAWCGILPCPSPGHVPQRRCHGPNLSVAPPLVRWSPWHDLQVNGICEDNIASACGREVSPLLVLSLPFTGM